MAFRKAPHMGSSKSYRGPGPAGAEEQRAIGPGKGKETRGTQSRDAFPDEASSGKGIKPSTRTRGQEE